MNSPVSHKAKASHLCSKLLFIIIFILSPLYAVAATFEVQVLDPSTFSPNELTIEVGDTVRWVNAAGGNSHDVTADDFSFSSQTTSSFTFERTFNSVAEILYHCTVHSSPASQGGVGMNGRINVVEATTSTDVSVESVNAIDGAYEAGEDLRVLATLKNNGAESSGMFNVNFYASTDAIITSGDTLLATKSISNINAGAIENIDESVNLPAGMMKGDYFIGIIIDLDDSDTSNNTGVDELIVYVFIEFTMNAGLNDAWFNPDTNGQGFFITIFPNLGFASIAWFTYDTELPPLDAIANLGDPGHRWVTGVGPITGDEAVLSIELTSGGIFDTPAEIERTDPPGSDGTFILKFKNCSSGTLEYDITSIDVQGTVPIVRAAADNVRLCNALLRESQLDQ